MVTAAPASCSTSVQLAARREAAAFYGNHGVEPGDLQPRPAGHRSWPGRGLDPYQPEDAWGSRKARINPHHTHQLPVNRNGPCKPRKTLPRLPCGSVRLVTHRNSGGRSEAVAREVRLGRVGLSIAPARSGKSTAD